MKKIFLFYLLVTSLIIFPQKTLAAAGRADCSLSPTQITSNDNSVTFNVGPTEVGKKYRIDIDINKFWWEIGGCQNPTSDWISATSTNGISATFGRGGTCGDRIFAVEPDNFNNISLFERGKSAPLCTSTYIVTSACELKISPTQLDTNTPITVTGTGVPLIKWPFLRITGPLPQRDVPISPQPDGTFSQSIGTLQSAGKGYQIQLRGTGGNPRCGALGPIEVGFPGNPKDNTDIDAGYTRDAGLLGGFRPTFCDPTETGIQTAVGCIPIRDTNQFVAWFLKWALGLAGGVAFILILIAGFQITTASGNPEKVQGGKELLNAAISGLILIIFSVFLLKLIGVDILALPGFAK